jgi:predicted nucleic acid-binding protein
VTIAEVFYVLARAYRLPKPEAASKLIPLLESDVIEVHARGRVLDALRRVARANVDFGDAYLAAFAAERGARVASFDADLLVFPDVETVVPK